MANLDQLRYAKGNISTADLRLTMQKVGHVTRVFGLLLIPASAPQLE